MTIKFHYISCFTLVVILLSCGFKLSLSATNSTTSSHGTVNEEVTGVQRYLKTSVVEEKGDQEERGPPSLSKVKELTNKRLESLKKLPETIKTKIHLHAVDSRFSKLGEVKSNVIGSSQYDDWAASVRKAYKYDQEVAGEAMVTALASRYGDDGLAAMLATAKQVRGTKTEAVYLENVQVNLWMAEGKKADDVYNLLKLDEAGENLLKKPELDVWITFTTRLKWSTYKTKLGEDPYDILLAKLKPLYVDDAGLASMLVRAKNDPASRTIAEKLETSHLEKWLKQEKTMMDVFKILKLNKEGSKVLTNPALDMWKAYAKMLNKDPDELLFLAFKRLGFDDAAAQVQPLLIKKWLTEKKSGANIFKFLGLNKAGDGVFENPMWNTWVAFLNRHKADANEVMFTVLRAQYGDQGLTKLVSKASQVASTKEIVAKLQRNVWRMNGQTSDEVFNLLKLDKMGDKLFESPELRTWVVYVRKLSTYARPNEFAPIIQLEKRFGTAKLARMLSSSKESTQNAATKRFVSSLQETQFWRWKTGKKDPTDVSEMLAKSSSLYKEENARVLRDYQVYFTSRTSRAV
ncbi:hypothetical protein DVH05_017816 [Phytophthora capsici]|nr:hypothetical protein DVH05_017816 [Phytophthora capsici]